MTEWLLGVISALAAMFLFSYVKKDKEIKKTEQEKNEAILKSRLMEVSNEAHLVDDHELSSRIRTLIAEHSAKK